MRIPTDQDNNGAHRRRSRANSFYQAPSDDSRRTQTSTPAEQPADTTHFWRSLSSQFKQAVDATYAVVSKATDELGKAAKDAGRATVSATRLATNLTKDHPLSEFQRFFSEQMRSQQHETSDILTCHESELFDRDLDDQTPDLWNTPSRAQALGQPCNWTYPAVSHEFKNTADCEEKSAHVDGDEKTVNSIQTEGTDSSAHTDGLDSSGHSNTLPDPVPINQPAKAFSPTTQINTSVYNESEIFTDYDIIDQTQVHRNTCPTIAQTCLLKDPAVLRQSSSVDSLYTQMPGEIGEDGDNQISKNNGGRKNRICPVAQPVAALDEHIYQFLPQATQSHPVTQCRAASEIVHDIGYCAPAALGLLLIELFNKDALSGDLHSAPTKLLLRLFKSHYALEFSTANDLLQYLHGRDVHTLQWIMAPVLRLLLLCILHTKSAKTSDIFFESNHEDTTKTSIEKNPFLDIKAIHCIFDISDEDIHTCNQLLCEANTSSKSTQSDSIAGYDQPFSTDDLFLVCRSLFIALKLHCAVVTSETPACVSLKNMLHSQVESRESQQAQLYSGDFGSVNAAIHYQAYIFDDNSGIMGHFDCIQGDEILNQACWMGQHRQQPSAHELHAEARLAHSNGPEFVKRLSTLEKTATEPEKTGKSNYYNHFFDDLELNLNQQNQNHTSLETQENRTHCGVGTPTETPLSEADNSHIGVPLDVLDTTHHGDHSDAIKEAHSAECQLGTDASAFNKVNRNNSF